jgi:hypothetical protein
MNLDGATHGTISWRVASHIQDVYGESPSTVVEKRVQPSVEQHRLHLKNAWQEEDCPGYVASLDDYTGTCGPIAGWASSPLHDCYQYMLLFSAHLG